MIHTPTYQIPDIDIEMPPTEDELPSDDGVPMETGRHRMQMELLIEPLEMAWSGRNFFAGGNMFVYFSPTQAYDYDYRGPDVFVALDVPPRERKSWVVWQEGKAPDVIIELLSESTAYFDKTEKKAIYQNRLRAPEYFWYDPFSHELAGFTLQKGVYKPIKADKQGRLMSDQLQLLVGRWHGTYKDIETTWLRWMTLDGAVLPTANELRMVEKQRANEEKQRADTAEQRANELARLVARYQEQFGTLPLSNLENDL